MTRGHPQVTLRRSLFPNAPSCAVLETFEAGMPAQAETIFTSQNLVGTSDEVLERFKMEILGSHLQ